MKGQILVSTGIAAAVIIICFVAYGTYNNNEVASEKIAMGFQPDKMVSVETYIQSMVEAGEMSRDAGNENIEGLDAQMYAIQDVNSSEQTEEAPKEPDLVYRGGNGVSAGAGTDGGPVERSISSLTQSELDELKAALEALDAMGMRAEPYSGPTSSGAGE